MRRRSSGSTSRRNARIPQCASSMPVRYSRLSSPDRIGLPMCRCVHGIAPGSMRPLKREPITRSSPSRMRSRKPGSAEKSYEPSASAITMTSPSASANPRMYADPYPRRRSLITRAPAAIAASADPSVEPLSTTITSPATPASSIARLASRTTEATLSTSLRHGRTTETPSLTSARLPAVTQRKPPRGRPPGAPTTARRRSARK